MFTGQIVNPGLPEELRKVLAFLIEKVECGDFIFSDDPEYWVEHEDIINVLGMGYVGSGFYFAISLAHLASVFDGNLIFPSRVNIWRWAFSLHLVSGVAEWDPSFMGRVVLSFEGKKDGIDGLLNSAVHEYAASYYNNAVVLMSILPQYRGPLLSGLMENDFNRCCCDFPPIENIDEFANAFVDANRLEPVEICSAFDMVVSFPNYTTFAAMAFYLAVLGKMDEQRDERCKRCIVNLLQGNTTPYVVPICNWLIKQKDVSSFGEECVILLLKGLNSGQRESSLRTIDNSIGLHTTPPEQLIRIFVCIAENLQATDILTMRVCLNNLSEAPEHFQGLVLSFIMHPKGLYRIVGRRLWDNYHLENSSFDPQKDLSEDFQCLFIVSMLQDYGNPETRLPKVLPLIDSESKKVRSVLMGQLGPYLDDYMGHVVNAIEKLKLDNKYIKTIKRYYETRSDVIEKRRRMKELSPRYSNASEYFETVRLQKVHMQEKMKEAEQSYKSSWKDMLKNVVLARGGGWRDEKGVVHHIPCFHISLPSRQLEQSMSPMEQEDWLNRVFDDWDDKARNN